MKNQSIPQLRPFSLSLALCGLCIIILSQLYLRYSPKTYRASTLISLNRWTSTKSVDKDAEKRLASSECHDLLSNTNLDQIIGELNLRERWRELVPHQTSLSMEAARNKLRLGLSSRPKGLSLSFEVAMTDANPREAAEIVRLCSEHYTQHRSNEIAQAVQTTVDAYKKGFFEADQKLRAAIQRVDELYSQVVAERNRDTKRYYDKESYELLLKKRADLTLELQDEQKRMDQLNSLTKGDLKKALLDTEKDAQLTDLLIQLGDANVRLAGYRNSAGSNPTMVASTEALINHLDGEVNNRLQNILKARHTRLESLADTLKIFDDKLKTATTNAPSLTYANLEYNQAKNDLAKMEAARSDLSRIQEDRMGQQPFSLLRLNYNPRILNPVEVPGLPFSPDPKLAQIALRIGIAVLLFAGLIFIFSGRIRTPPRRN